MFVVFSLPRSRSAWLSVFLGQNGRGAGHDIGIECATPEDFIDHLKGLGGTCETGAAFAWPLIRQALPDVKFAVILRDPAEVCASLARFGLTGLEDEMAQRVAHLSEIAALPGTLNLTYEALADPQACRLLFEHCREEPFDAENWRRLAALNIQVDMPARLARLHANHDRIEGLKASVRGRLSGVGYAVGPEPWGPLFWSEAEALAEQHFEEVDGGVEPRRKLKVDVALMDALRDAGALKIITARKNGKLVGYYTWNISRDVESEGLLIAQQGAWFVAPSHPRVAVLMFDKAVQTLRDCGVRCIYPHHRVQGRGANIGRFFQRRGATKIQDTYSLWIGD